MIVINRFYFFYTKQNIYEKAQQMYFEMYFI